MAKPIRWSPKADEDLEKILDYLADEWEEAVSLKFLDLIDILLNQIAISPRQFPLINKSLNIRKCVLTKHNTLFYRNKRTVIEVVRIYDTRQDPEKLQFYGNCS
jgi:plasmid stabilization system protein ParE